MTNSYLAQTTSSQINQISTWAPQFNNAFLWHNQFLGATIFVMAVGAILSRFLR